ncbi:MAG: response regulator [Symploca sp. SIO3C6]|uniref:Response regulator n=1 Tax=Symploca sp. SIO1C4 TaxID=2607765 RepID=A0A6B3NJ73_9CYAN|nr:response regulator [Symploca sp. SIO3C6]NER30572.1 response regulator [Symploca sp. SIO1C4]NET05849.1 response regulator [Symploca sp. SIO2B6]NET53392.1 response regulator [Merismopedia sp. SIO2A8]
MQLILSRYLLDLNLPRKDGREVLKEVKSDDNLKCIPIVVLTTSDTDQDILQCYNLGANCYISKPLSLEEFAQIMKLIEDFWFSIVIALRARLQGRRLQGRI